jgi:hypothetical protein
MYVTHTNLTSPGFASRQGEKGNHQRAIQGYSTSVKHNDSEDQDSVRFQGKSNPVDPDAIELDTLTLSSYTALKNPRNQLIHTFISWGPKHGRPDENIFQQGDWKTRNTRKAFQLLKHPDVRLGKGDLGPKKMAMPKRLLDHEQNFEWLTDQIGSREGAWAFTKAVLTLFYQERDKLSLDKATDAAEMRIKAHQKKLDSAKSKRAPSASPNPKKSSFWPWPWARFKPDAEYELPDWRISYKTF